MQTSFRIARIHGVEIGANWSWLLVVALIFWALAAGVFPDRNPGLSDATYLVMAAVAVLLFFASLLLHELGHAVRAQREGMEIAGITLWVFGGVARFKGAFPSAGAEFRIAIAGPLVSLAFGVVFLGAALALPLPKAVDGVVYWLGYINLLVLAFNMLPALPLDGGRVLRSALWHFKGDFAAATRIAAGLGRLFGQVLIGLGVILVILGGVLGGVWLAFIGWFLLMAAEGESRTVLAQNALRGLRVEDVMIREPETADAGLALDRFIEDVFFLHRHATYPVLEGGRPVGLVSFRRVAGIPRARWPELRVRDAMATLAEAPVVGPDDGLFEALGRLAESELGRALVCDGDRLRGLLSMTDVARVLEVRQSAAATAPAGQAPPPAPAPGARPAPR